MPSASLAWPAWERIYDVAPDLRGHGSGGQGPGLSVWIPCPVLALPLKVAAVRLPPPEASPT